jgi:ACS family hexuronate transporter-like MFS transporter
MDRQVLSLTWKDFIASEFHWTNNDYGNITSLFSIFYAISMLFAGRFVDWLDTKKGFLWAIGVWSVGACLHAFCGIATSGILTGQWLVGFKEAREAIGTVDNVGMIINVTVTLFVFARFVLALGEAGNFPASIKATAEYFPKKDRAYATSIFNAGATVGALVAPFSIPIIASGHSVFFGWAHGYLFIRNQMQTHMSTKLNWFIFDKIKMITPQMLKGGQCESFRSKNVSNTNKPGLLVLVNL